MQPWKNARTNATYQAHGVLEQLNDRDVTLPDSVTAAIATLERIENDPPRQPSQTALREAILDGAEQEQINALLLADLGHQRLRGEHAQARIDAALAVLRAIRDAHDDLHLQLKTRAEKQIDHLDAVAALDTADVMQLVRAGDHRGAQLVAEVDVAAAELDALYGIRDGYLAAGGYDAMRLGPVDASRWRDPEQPGRGDTPAARFLDGLRRGNTLWFPTKSEALDAAEPAYQRAQRKAERDAQVRRQQNRDATTFAL
jgi:hypothetical protein